MADAVNTNTHTHTTTISQDAFDRAVRQAIQRKQRIHELETRLAALTKEHETLAAALKTAAAERDDLKTKLEADPDGLRAKVLELEGQIRTRAHRDAFGAAAGKFKGPNGETVVPSAVDALWTLSGYKPEGDQADEAKLLKAIGDAVASNPFCLQAPDGAKDKGTAPPPAPRPPGPGLSRGAPETTTPPRDAKGQAEAAFAAIGRSNPYRIA